MKLRFRHQSFQAEAAKAVCDVFAGQPFYAPTCMMDTGWERLSAAAAKDFTGFSNAPVVISGDAVLENIRAVQIREGVKQSNSLEGRFNLTIEMETGVGKTYTYIKTMYELNKLYGWSKFIIVVPSVAVREGVYKSFRMTEEHFTEGYGKRIRFFIYNSARLPEIDRFASDSAMNVMIINSQAFNARGKDARRIYMKSDEFRSRRPIDIIAKANPIIIIDEPQSVEGAATKNRLKEFNPLLTLRYSATHRPDSVYNMIYRLDAPEAYNKRLVKKIAVKGISVTGGTAVDGYVYLQNINLSKTGPTAVIEFDVKGKKGLRREVRVVSEGYSLFDRSGGLAEYDDGYTVMRIDGRDSSVEFANGKKLFIGDAIGSVGEEQLCRIQIRETILSHFERERQLFGMGIKVLSLFFIDEVAKYKRYDAANNELNGVYAEIFEDEYENIKNTIRLELLDSTEYLAYLDKIDVKQTHAGYFSIDKKSGRKIDGKLGDKKERTSDDTDAYDLIMRDKERLLDLGEPVRFIFSHSALREGWDNPNVFQICTLKRSGSDVRKRQEVGRGLRLSVNQAGERMDESVLGRGEVHKINVLTIIAGESYEAFAGALQSEIAEAVANYDPDVNKPEDARKNTAEAVFGKDKRNSKEFRPRISADDCYAVKFDEAELIGKTVKALNDKLIVSKIYFKVETGVQTKSVEFKERFEAEETAAGMTMGAGSSVRYDLVGRIVAETGLTRKAVAKILIGIEKRVFDQFGGNPEEFIIRAAGIVNEQKAAAIKEQINAG
jgi:type III restriction enzyme